MPGANKQNPRSEGCGTGICFSRGSEEFYPATPLKTLCHFLPMAIAAQKLTQARWVRLKRKLRDFASATGTSPTALMHDAITSTLASLLICHFAKLTFS